MIDVDEGKLCPMLSFDLNTTWLLQKNGVLNVLTEADRYQATKRPFPGF
jgi:hypothetical protein